MSLSREITKTEKVLIAVLAIIILAIAYFFLVFTPINNRIKEIDVAMVTLEDEFIILEAQQTLMTTMEAAVTKAKAEPKVIEAPDYDNMKNVAAMLNGIMAGTEGYTMSFDTLKDTDLAESIIRRKGKITFLCNNYAQTKTVLNQLYAGPYRCQISDMTVRANNTATGQDQNKATISRDEVQVDMNITYYEVNTVTPVPAETTTT